MHYINRHRITRHNTSIKFHIQNTSTNASNVYKHTEESKWEVNLLLCLQQSIMNAQCIFFQHNHPFYKRILCSSWYTFWSQIWTIWGWGHENFKFQLPYFLFLQQQLLQNADACYHGAKEPPWTTNLFACCASPASDILTPTDHKNRSQLTVPQWCNSNAVPPSLTKTCKQTQH